MACVQCEDWQGEKSEIPLYEMVTPQRILAILEEAEAWLASGWQLLKYLLPHAHKANSRGSPSQRGVAVSDTVS